MAKIVLIAEENAAIRTLVRITLSSDGFTTLECDNLHDALHILLLERPNLIYTHLGSRTHTEQESLRNLVEHASKIDCQVIALGTTEEEGQRLIESGAATYLLKPFSPIELLKSAHSFSRKD